MFVYETKMDTSRRHQQYLSLGFVKSTHPPKCMTPTGFRFSPHSWRVVFTLHHAGNPNMITDSFKSWINIIIIYSIYPFSLSSEILSFLFGCCTNTNDPSKLFVSLFRLFFLWYIKTWWEWPFLLARSRWARFSDIIYLSSVVSLSRDDGWHSKYLTNLLYIGIFICCVLYIYIFQNEGWGTPDDEVDGKRLFGGWWKAKERASWQARPTTTTQERKIVQTV